MSVSTVTIKQLYGHSYNQCAHPDCDQPLVEIDPLTKKAVVYGEIAHIHGKKPGAERFSQDLYQDQAKLDGFDNLILLCAKHHKQIDETSAGETYTAELIRTWKSDHMLKHSSEADREWVYGGGSIGFWAGTESITINYWITKAGELRFFTPEQLAQANAARDVSLLIAQLGSLLGMLDQASGEPADPSRQTENDGYMRQLKQQAEQMKKGLFATVPEGGYESALHRLYDRLWACPDITLGELGEVGTKGREMKTTLIIGEATPERIAETIQGIKDQRNSD